MEPLMNKALLNNVEKIRKQYLSNIPHDSNEFSLLVSPFKVLKLKNVLHPVHYQKELKDDLQKLNFSKKDNDLYSLWQTEGLNDCDSKNVKNFIRTLVKEIAPFLSRVCNVELNNKISITGSLYRYGDVLLCHDDKCGDRCIAFVYYLTGSDEGGGSFDMFDHNENNYQPTNISHSLPPEVNSLVCFEVGNLTYHQVSEVTDKKFERLSINGWFHSNRKLNVLKYEEPLPPMQKQICLKGLVLLDKFINLLYCTPSNLIQIQEQFEDESFIFLKNMFVKKYFKLYSNTIKSKRIKWKKMGPANRRNYEVADVKSLPRYMKTFLKFLKSSLFVAYLRNITGLSLEPLSGSKSASEFSLELIRWTPGCYTMVTDNDAFFKKTGLDLYLYLCSSDALLNNTDNSSGYITYLATDGDDSSDKELITIVPEDNSLVLVYRTEDTVRFTKYINHSIEKEYYAIYATYYEHQSQNVR